MREDLVLDSDFTAEVYDQQPTVLPENIPGAGAAVTSINGLSGPAVTFGGGTTGMSFSVAAPNIDLTGTLVVANGGTGATTAAGARTSLGAATSGANADITSLSGLTTALSIAQGGTGGATAAAARTSLGIDDIATKKSNLSAIVAPTVNEDSGDGYAVGSFWCDVTADDAYICLDASVGAAVWKKITP